MIAVINDVSFQERFATIEAAMNRMHQFLDICKRIQKEEITNIHEIKTGLIDGQIEIAPNYKLIQLLQEFRQREERTLLLSILTNKGTYRTEEESVCKINGKKTSVPLQNVQDFLISLLSNVVYEAPVLKVTMEQGDKEMRNISKDEHIYYYRQDLGLRKYCANDKKHKFDRENYYGKGKVGSRMDLSDEEAQELLNKAIYIKGRLFAKKDDHYYAFQREQDIIYHGYRVDDLRDDIKKTLDKEFL